MTIPEDSERAAGLERWIGLAEVTHDLGSDVLDEGCSAYVPVVGDASDPADFFRLASEEFATLRLRLIRLDDVEHLSLRRRKHALPDALENAISQMANTTRLVYGSFHTFRDDEGEPAARMLNEE